MKRKKLMSSKSNRKTSRTPLNKEQIVHEAVKLADVSGIEALSMRKLGKLLGVEAMALYHHFASKEVLIDYMVDSIHAEIELPKETDEWNLAMRRRAISAVEAISKHHWVAPLMESRQNPGTASMRLIDATVNSLRSAGFSVDMVAHALSLLDAYTFGFAGQLRPEETVEQSAQMGIDIMEHFPFDMYPHVGEFVADHVVASGYRTMDEFYYGLDLILNGISMLQPTE